MLADFIWPFIKKVLPWTMLIMVISLGVAIMTGATAIIQQSGQVGDSYLYLHNINGTKYYTYDFQKYINGLNFEDIFKIWKETALRFQTIWENMQQNIDFSGNQNAKWFKSLLNGIIMIPNMIANVLNMVLLLPLQLITQVLTIVFRILGQQVNSQSQFWLGKILYNVNTWKGIPMIPYVTV